MEEQLRAKAVQTSLPKVECRDDPFCFLFPRALLAKIVFQDLSCRVIGNQIPFSFSQDSGKVACNGSSGLVLPSDERLCLRPDKCGHAQPAEDWENNQKLR